jgi:hypothetical protein
VYAGGDAVVVVVFCLMLLIKINWPFSSPPPSDDPNHGRAKSQNHHSPQPITTVFKTSKAGKINNGRQIFRVAYLR